MELDFITNPIMIPMTRFQQIYFALDRRPKLHKNFKEKVSGMHHNLGIGFPTTIGYNFCAPEKVDIFAYFICWGFATSITEKSFHHLALALLFEIPQGRFAPRSGSWHPLR